MTDDKMIRSPFFIAIGLSAILALGVDWFSRGFIRQADLRLLYQSLFVLILSLIAYAVAHRLPKNIWLSVGYGIAVGTIVGSISMFAACLILKSDTTFHAIKSSGLGEEILVLTVLSMLGGSWAIGGITFLALRCRKPAIEAPR